MLPYFCKIWIRVYSSTVGDRLPIYSLSGLADEDEEEGTGDGLGLFDMFFYMYV